MRKYDYAINKYYKTASLIIDDAPWYIFALDAIVEKVCSVFPPIPFPSIKKKLSEEDKKVFGEEHTTTWKDWYGDLSQLFCCKIHNPISDFCFKHTNGRMVDIDYEKLKEATKSDSHWTHELLFAEDDEEEKK